MQAETTIYFGVRWVLFIVVLTTSLIESVQIGDLPVTPTSSARNLGVIFDQCFNPEEHIRVMCKSPHYQIRNIAKIRKYVTEESTTETCCIRLGYF